MATIRRPVGGKIPNPNSDEVLLVQKLLNKHRSPPLKQILENGKENQETKDAIAEFQHRVVGLAHPDGRVDPGGKTLAALNIQVPVAVAKTTAVAGFFSHPDADKVTLKYATQGDGLKVVELNSQAAQLLKSILASIGMTGGQLNSTLRTYHDQARITATQTYPKKNGPETVKKWYGSEVLEACEKYLNDIDAFAKWWEQHDRKHHKVSSKHLSNRAMDVVPSGDRTKFVKKVEELKNVKGSGVTRIIPKGVMNEPVDHVEFGFDVTDGRK